MAGSPISLCNNFYSSRAATQLGEPLCRYYPNALFLHKAQPVHADSEGNFSMGNFPANKKSLHTVSRIERIFFFDHYVNHASRSARQYPARHTDPSDQAVPAFHRYAFTLTALHKVPAADSNQYPRLLLISLPDLRCSCDVLSARHRCLQVCRSSS